MTTEAPAPEATPPTTAPQPPPEPWHGTLNGYTNRGCRCPACREESRKSGAAQRAQRVARMAADPTVAPHGLASTYGNWGCRCPECTRAWSIQSLDYNRRRRQGMQRVPGRPVQLLKHGTAYAYRNKKCHCPECEAWNNSRRQPQPQTQPQPRQESA